MKRLQANSKCIARLLRVLFCASPVAIMATAPVWAAARDNGVYCVYPPTGGFLRFVQKHQPSGDLEFYVALWGENFMGVNGTARLAGENHWVYETGQASDDPNDHCKVDITGTADGGFHVMGDRFAPCTNQGGAGTQIGSIAFPADSYAGQVTDQLEHFEEGKDLCDDKKEHHPGG